MSSLAGRREEILLVYCFSHCLMRIKAAKETLFLETPFQIMILLFLWYMYSMSIEYICEWMQYFCFLGSFSRDFKVSVGLKRGDFALAMWTIYLTLTVLEREKKVTETCRLFVLHIVLFLLWKCQPAKMIAPATYRNFVMNNFMAVSWNIEDTFSGSKIIEITQGNHSNVQSDFWDYKIFQCLRIKFLCPSS